MVIERIEDWRRRKWWSAARITAELAGIGLGPPTPREPPARRHRLSHPPTTNTKDEVKLSAPTAATASAWPKHARTARIRSKHKDPRREVMSTPPDLAARSASMGFGDRNPAPRLKGDCW